MGFKKSKKMKKHDPEVYELENSKDGNNVTSYSGVFVLIAILLLIFVFDFSFISGKIIAYEIYCESASIGGLCEFKNFSKTEYFPYSINQTVKAKNEGGVKEFTKCTVIDRKNWECKYNDESAVFGFLNGFFHSTTLYTKMMTEEQMIRTDGNTRYVPKFLYNYEQLKYLLSSINN